MSAVLPQKRPLVFIQPDQSGNREAKKSRFEPGQGSPTAIIARVAVTSDETMCKTNAVWLNPADLSQLYPGTSSIDSQVTRLVNLAGNIFHVAEMASLPQGTILVNFLQNEEIRLGRFQASGSDQIMATAVDKSLEHYPTVEDLEIQLEPIISTTTKFVFPLNLLRDKVRQDLNGRVLKQQQKLYFEMNGYGFRLNTSTADTGSISHKRITADTRIDFIKNPSTIIYNREYRIGSKNQQEVELELTSYNSGNNKEVPNDLFIDVKLLKSKVIGSLLSQRMHLNDETKVIDDEDGKSFSLVLKLPREDKEHNYETLYTFEKDFYDFKLNVSPKLKNSLILYSGTKNATHVAFKISRIQSNCALYPTLKVKGDEDFFHSEADKSSLSTWVSLEELTKFVKTFPGFLNDLKIDKDGKNASLAFNVKDIQPVDPQKDKSFPVLRTVTDMTEFKFVSKEKNLVIVDHGRALEISKIVIEIKRQPQTSLFNPNPKINSESLAKEKLEEVCRKSLKGKVYSNLSLLIKCKNAGKEKIELRIKIKKLQFATMQFQPEYGYLGNITDNTKFDFKLPFDSKIKLTNEKDKNFPQMDINQLEEIVGGISEQLKVILRKVMLSRGSLKDQFNKRGHKPIKGMLLYGPPGTGKTTLARNIGKIFGCSGERFQLLNASELTDKYVGETERKIRDLFIPAEVAQKSDGENSELHLIVIDECDGVFGRRQANSDQHCYNSWVNQLLGKIDGFAQLNNIFIILMTNRKEIIDPAILRPGRIELHLELGLTDKAGRKQIFAIHTKSLVDENLLDDIDFDKLVDATAGFSGAEIEGVVKDASSYSLERLAMLPEKEVEGHKDGRVTMEDFQLAIDSCRLSKSSE